MMSDLVDGVNKFGADWERIKNEYKFTVTMSALKKKFHYNKKYQHIALEDGKWKVLPGNYIWSAYLQEPIMRKHTYY